MTTDGWKTIKLAAQTTAFLAVSVILYWLLVHGLVLTRYQQFAQNGVFPDNPQSELLQADQDSQQLGHTGFFWSEAAFHYRTTLMYTGDWHETPDALDQDMAQQYPSGIDAGKKYSLFMEPVLGALYRWFSSPGQSLIDFLMWCLPFLHACLLVPVFLLARKLGASSGMAATSVLVFCTSSLAFSPLLDAVYVKETLSWLLLAFFLVGHFSVLNRFSWPILLLTSIALSLFLVSWHLAQFIAMVIFLAGFLFESGRVSTDGPPPSYSLPLIKDRWPLPSGVWLPLVYLVAVMFAGLAPWLRDRYFILSPPVGLLLVWLILAMVRHRSADLLNEGRNRLFALLAGLILVVVVSSMNSKFSGDYSHVSGLLWHRIVHLFTKPWDPTELPFAVRVFWVSPFTSPRLAVLEQGIGFNGFPLALGVVGTGWACFSRQTSAAVRVFSISLLGFFLAFLFVERLAPVFLFFGSIGVALAGTTMTRRWKAHAWPGGWSSSFWLSLY